MTFLDLVAGDAVFIDANTFVYYFAPDPGGAVRAASCSSVSRIKRSRAIPPPPSSAK
jgi:hypothetical protein